MINELKFHHIGIAVDSIDDSVKNYIQLFGVDCISKKYEISSQMVNVCFVKVGEDTYLELIEANGEDSSIHRLRKKGHSYYHTAYKTKEIEKQVEKLNALNYKSLNYFYSEAFENKRCIFLFSPEAHLIELIEE